MTNLRDLPSVEQLLQARPALALITRFGRPLTLDAVRQVLAELRPLIASGEVQLIPTHSQLLASTASLLAQWTAPSIQPVINATGVILHTNLGRAPLSSAALSAMAEASRGYATLEFDLPSGKRGSRLVHAESLLVRLVGAQAAVVVNNNAAAVLLILSALARRKPVIIARSQLIEIGGGFRIPDVMKQSGARLVEVGTTNKVHLSDYEEALQVVSPSSTSSGLFPALIMHAHRSNFQITGFTEEPALAALAALAHRNNVPLIDDLGSGALLDTTRFGMAHEPTVQESLAAGSDVVCFSGDKLLGGPQAGIILGRQHLLALIRKHPLARALRADKLCLSALSATLLHYLQDQAVDQVPVWRMIARTPASIRKVAESWKRHLGQGEVIPSESTVGGGSLPGETLPTFVLALRVPAPAKVMSALRQSSPPLIARTEGERILLDPRTVLPEQEETLLSILSGLLPQPPARKRG